MKNSMTPLGLLLLGTGMLMLSCGRASPSPEPVAEAPTATTVPVKPTASLLPATLAPESASTEVPDHTCPPMTGNGPAIQPHPDQADYHADIAEYLSEGGSLEGLKEELELLDDLRGQQKVSVIGIDVTGDGQADVVVESLWFPPGEPVQGYAYVLTCEGGRYVAQTVADLGFTASFTDTSKNQSLGLRAVEDLTGDGLPELVFSFVETPEMLPVDDPSAYVSGYTRFFEVVGWNGAEFADLLPEGSLGRRVVGIINGDGSLTDTDGDGLKELVLRGGGPEPGFGHPLTRAETITWGWNETGFALRCASFGAPTYRFQAVEDGDAAVLCQDLDKALESYQAAIFDEKLRPWEGDELGLVPAPENERDMLSAYSRYRLMLVHIVKGTGDAASVVYDTLTKSFPPGNPGGIYAELATVVWGEYQTSHDLPAACRKAIAQAEEWGLAPLANSYGYESPLYESSDYLCPY